MSKPAPNAQTLWCWLVVGPCTTSIPGLVLGSRSQLAARIELDHGWERDGFDLAVEEIGRRGMALVDESFIWLPGEILRLENLPENPNVVTGWGKVWAEVPWCPLKDQVHVEIREFLSGIGEPRGKGLMRAFLEAFGEPLPKDQRLPFQEALPLSFGKDPPPPFGESGTGTGTGTRRASVRSSHTTVKETDKNPPERPNARLDVSRETLLDPSPADLVTACCDIATDLKGRKCTTLGAARRMGELMKTRSPLDVKAVWTHFVVTRRKRTRMTFGDFFDHYEEHERLFVERKKEGTTA